MHIEHICEQVLTKKKPFSSLAETSIEYIRIPHSLENIFVYEQISPATRKKLFNSILNLQYLCWKIHLMPDKDPWCA